MNLRNLALRAPAVVALLLIGAGASWVLTRSGAESPPVTEAEAEVLLPPQTAATATAEARADAVRARATTTAATSAAIDAAVEARMVATAAAIPPPPPTPTPRPRPTPTPPAPLSAMISQARPGVVRIDTPSGSGSGVIVTTQGQEAYVITNYHVIEGYGGVGVTVSDAATRSLVPGPGAAAG